MCSVSHYVALHYALIAKARLFKIDFFEYCKLLVRYSYFMLRFFGANVSYLSIL